MNDLLVGKNVFITGAGANIGKSIALEMALQGASIFFADREASRVSALESQLHQQDVKAQGFVCDLSRIASVEEIMRQLSEQNIIIDILVNNLGLTVREPETTPQSFERWQRTFDSNVLVPLYLSRLVAQTMIEAQNAGSIIFISSIHQWLPFGDQIYSATKASVGMIAEELAVSLAPHGIRVNSIAPGRCIEGADSNPIFHAGTPLYHESVKPCYIGRAAVFLASDYFSHYTTGATLKIDGGLSLYNFANSHQITEPPPVSRARKLWRLQRQRLHNLRSRLGENSR